MTSRLGALAGPIALKVPGSPEWCWQVVQSLKDQMRHVAEQWTQAEETLQALERAKAYKKIPPEKPYGTLDAMLRAEVGLPVKEVRQNITTAKDRAKALEGKTVRGAKPGPMSQEENANPDIIRIGGVTGGTSAEYLTRRIARDHPDILKRMQAGEFRSVRAAALEAGIMPRTFTVRADNTTSAARTLRKHMKPEQLAELARLLTEEN